MSGEFTDSLRKNGKGIILMLVSAAFVSVGQLFWKLSAAGSLAFLAIGLGCYAAGALCMLYAYRFGSLSVLQPVLCVSYAASIILGSVVLGEAITVVKIAGTVLIIAGVVCIVGGDGE
jgi:drug/metabolite transporter (DMT)-like permease